MNALASAALAIRLPAPAQPLIDDELIEFVATYAAERGDFALESMCDSVLSGDTSESVLIATVHHDDELRDAVAAWRGCDRDELAWRRL